MWYLTLALNKFFDLMLIPFQSVHPFWPLLIFSLPLGILMLIVFRYTSNQRGIKEAKDRIKAHLLEIRIFKDDLRILFSAQKNIVLWNLKYICHALRPMLFMIVPIAVILIQLEGWFGYRPLKPGESAIVSVKMTEGKEEVLSNISLEVDRGLVVETRPLRVFKEREVSWRIRANEPGEHNLVVRTSDSMFQKQVVVSDGRLVRVSPRVVAASSLGDTFVNPGEKPIADSAVVQRIEVDYPSRSIKIFGQEMHWLLVFFILSLMFGFMLKRAFRVEI